MTNFEFNKFLEHKELKPIHYQRVKLERRNLDNWKNDEVSFMKKLIEMLGESDLSKILRGTLPAIEVGQQAL